MVHKSLLSEIDSVGRVKAGPSAFIEPSGAKILFLGSMGQEKWPMKKGGGEGGL